MNKLMLVILMMFCINAFAESYKWVDENGRVHYSDQPPASSMNSKIVGPTSKPKSSTGSDATDSSSATDSSESGEPKSIAEREAELKKKQKADQEAAAKSAKDQANKDVNQENCNQAKLSLKTFESGMRIKEVGSSGEQVYLDDEQRQQRIEKTRQDIDRLCK